MGTAADERFLDVYYASSTDGGNSWSANTRITNPSIDGDVGVTFNNNDVRGPMGIASTSNASYITWADARPSGGQDQEAEDVYFYFSRVRYMAAPELAAAGGESNELLWALLGAAAAITLGGLVLLLVSRRTAGGRRRGQGQAPGSSYRRGRHVSPSGRLNPTRHLHRVPDEASTVPAAVAR